MGPWTSLQSRNLLGSPRAGARSSASGGAFEASSRAPPAGSTAPAAAGATCDAAAGPGWCGRSPRAPRAPRRASWAAGLREDGERLEPPLGPRRPLREPPSREERGEQPLRAPRGPPDSFPPPASTAPPPGRRPGLQCSPHSLSMISRSFSSLWSWRSSAASPRSKAARQPPPRAGRGEAAGPLAEAAGAGRWPHR